MTNTHAKAPTLAAFTTWAQTHYPAAKTVLMARIFAEMERKRVDAYIAPIFAGYTFTVRPEWQDKLHKTIITTPRDLYLVETDATVTAFYADCDAAHRAHGFTGQAGYCPALVAESLVPMAENALMDMAEPLFGIEACDLYGDNREKYLELLIGACLKGGH